MARRRRKKLPDTLFQVDITDLSHEGRGVARLDGKTLFVDGALPGETVEVQYTARQRRFDSARTVSVIDGSPDRIEPACEFAGICGGCSLQHMAPEAQRTHKQRVLAEQFLHFGKVEPETWLDPLKGPAEGYRYKARMGVRFVPKKEAVLVGFREKQSNFLANIDHCPVLVPVFGENIQSLKTLFYTLEKRDRIAQLEVAAGDEQAAMVVRHLDPLPSGDLTKLANFCQEKGIQLWLQPGGPETVHLHDESQNPEQRLVYALPEFGLEFGFHPMDFTQVNPHINRQMVARAVNLLAPGKEERVLDLFCGLGNFTLPIARQAGQVVGVEGSQAMVVRAEENARRNGIENASFHAADLHQPFDHHPWAKQGFDKVLIDPPRSGAELMMDHLLKLAPGRIVYVSCNPATLARDAGILVAGGYRLVKAGIMDMFPHTAHVESIAVFER